MRGAALGRQLVVRFAAVDRLVSFLRLLSAEQSLDDLQPGFRIVYARGGAGTREAIVLMPAAQALGDAVAQAARLAGGQVFTGAGKHFVQFRETRAPLGYDVEALSDGAGDLIFYGLEETVPYRIESELPLGNLLLRLSLVRLHGRALKLPEGTIYVTARRGLGTVVAGILHRAGGYLRERRRDDARDGGPLRERRPERVLVGRVVLDLPDRATAAPALPAAVDDAGAGALSAGHRQCGGGRRIPPSDPSRGLPGQLRRRSPASLRARAA